MSTDQKETKNEELEILGTHMAGATDLFQTRKTEKEVQVEPPEHPGAPGSSGVY